MFQSFLENWSGYLSIVIEGATNIRILRFYDVSVIIVTCNKNIELENASALQSDCLSSVSCSMSLGATFA